MSDAFICMKNITKSFPGTLALSDVDINIRAGEIHGLVGENGAGKSTLINILAGVFPPTDGEILISGSTVSFQHPAEALSKGIGVVYQETVLVPDFTAEENIWLARETGSIGFIKQRDITEKTRELIKEYGISIPLSVPVRDLRVAEQKLVEVLRALSVDAKVLVLDEPTESMPSNDAENLFRILRGLREKGIAILYVSHRLEEVLSICDRITVFKNGRRIETGDIKEFDVSRLVSLITDKDVSEQDSPANSDVSDIRILEVENLKSAALGLKEISFHLNSGEILGFFGMVGSKRTELMKCLFGAEKRDSGTVKFNEKETFFRQPAEAMKEGLYLCPEDRRTEGLVLDMTVSENTTLPFLSSFSSFGMVNRKKEESSSKKISEDLLIKTPSIHQKTALLSGGNQQKVVIGKWLAGPEGRVFIFDEPTKGIDIGAKGEVYKLMKEIAAGGAGVIFVSSDLRELTGISNRLCIMKEGRIVKEFLQNDFNQEAILKAALSSETV